jgi:hypothetical protein
MTPHGIAACPENVYKAYKPPALLSRHDISITMRFTSSSGSIEATTVIGVTFTPTALLI